MRGHVSAPYSGAEMTVVFVKSELGMLGDVTTLFYWSPEGLSHDTCSQSIATVDLREEVARVGNF